MNKNRFYQLMSSVDDDLLEEAQRPARRSRPRILAAASVAACFVIVAAVYFLKAPAAGNVQLPNPVQETTLADIRQLGYSVPVPGDASSVSYSIIDLSSGSAPMAEVSFERGGQTYSLRALKAAQPEDISGIYASWSDSLDWHVETLEMQLRQSDDNSWVGWYAPDAGVQWCLSGKEDALSLLHTAQEIVETLGYNMTVAPAGASDVVYNAFELDGLVVGETVFTLNGTVFSFRTASTSLIEDEFADISGLDREYQTASSGEVDWCPARLCFDEGGAGKIVWFDVVPGLLYSLSMDSGASEDALLSMAEQLFVPAQGEVG